MRAFTAALESMEKPPFSIGGTEITSKKDSTPVGANVGSSRQKGEGKKLKVS
jgi:hypothetical protein